MLRLHISFFVFASGTTFLSTTPSSRSSHSHLLQTTPVSPQQQSALISGELQCHNVSHICSFSCSVFPTLFHPNPLHPKHLPGLISMQNGYCIFLSTANQMEISWVCFLTSCLRVLTAFQSRHRALTTAAISEVLTILAHRILTAVQ